MRALKLIVSSALLIAAAASAAAYCDSFPTVEQEFKATALVFVGRVTSAREVRVRSQAVSGGAFYSVKVAQALKGGPSKMVELYSENSSGRFPMQVGEQYLVFADYGVFEGIRGRKLAVNNCGNSAPLPKGNKTLETVRRLTKA
jgi:hypothetical protein